MRLDLFHGFQVISSSLWTASSIIASLYLKALKIAIYYKISMVSPYLMHLIQFISCLLGSVIGN